MWVKVRSRGGTACVDAVALPPPSAGSGDAGRRPPRRLGGSEPGPRAAIGESRSLDLPSYTRAHWLLARRTP